MSTDKAKYTPGPWEFTPSEYYGFTTLWNPETREEIITTGGYNDGDSPITWMGEELTEANARLIAAAPELLEALIGLIPAAVWFFDGPYGASPERESLDRALAIIAKAAGEQKNSNTPA